MIASIFSKSKPINFIIVFFITVLAFFMARKNLIINDFSVGFIFKQLGMFLLCCLTILVINFIIYKNNLTNKNNYDILLFSLFLLLFYQTTNNTYILLSNFFVLLGLRRLISLHTQKSIKKKLFDAAFWFGIATLFYFWSGLFFILTIISLLLYTDNNIRHWIIPFVGYLTVFIIAISVWLITNRDVTFSFNLKDFISFDFSIYNTTNYLIGTTFALSFGIWASIFYVQNIKKKKKSLRVSFKIVMLAAVIAFFVIILSPLKTGSEFLFAFAPLAIIITNYLQTIQENWFKEVFLSMLFVVPFLLLLL
ncbi:DUF6427 family protein [Siansivirga zeaxanthinifaciens]|uniref:Membrane protein n=1 Tax=Siansivirga zeaxanthinifaciens CC-SAMT-1 TaxID=1454006 RepID=A0A0C5WJE3_9FLAO|nr:DUF6427 family protein [Siansivirga zeaxanthinifaciens]AJR02860.1 membrane protein [Siansivirga zeaxanthinifaciens CC-SAMT-1]